jgi:hypothetical protein
MGWYPRAFANITEPADAITAISMSIPSALHIFPSKGIPPFKHLPFADYCVAALRLVCGSFLDSTGQRPPVQAGRLYSGSLDSGTSPE